MVENGWKVDTDKTDLLDNQMQDRQEFVCLPLPQTWAPGNIADCPAPQQPGKIFDSLSGCRPHTGAPLHHPVKTKQTSIWVCTHAEPVATPNPLARTLRSESLGFFIGSELLWQCYRECKQADDL